MANTKDNGKRYKDAIVDTAVGSEGFASDPVRSSSKGRIGYLAFSVRGSGSANVTLQFKCIGDSEWTDYNLSPYTPGDRELIEGSGNGVYWRGIIKDGDYNSGTVKFGIDW
jgi:hypothetical protein